MAKREPKHEKDVQKIDLNNLDSIREMYEPSNEIAFTRDPNGGQVEYVELDTTVFLLQPKK